MIPTDQNSQLIFRKVTLPSSLHAEQIHKNYQIILLTSRKNKLWKIWGHAALLIFKQEEGKWWSSPTAGAALSPIPAKTQKISRKQVPFQRWSVWHRCGLWLKQCQSVATLMATNYNSLAQQNYAKRKTPTIVQIKLFLQIPKAH